MPDKVYQKSPEKKPSFWDSLKQYAVASAAFFGFAHGSSADPSVTMTVKEKVPDPVTVADQSAQCADLVQKLADFDAQRFTELYGKHTDALVKELQVYSEKYNENMNKHILEISAAIDQYEKSSSFQNFEKEKNELMEQWYSGKISQDECGEKIRALKEVYRVAEIQDSIYVSKIGIPPERFANKTFGLGNGSESYCMALQTEALKRTAEEMGISELNGVRDACGWTVKYAENSFKTNGFGKDTKIGDLFTLDGNGNAVVNKGTDGKPLVKDGDIALLKQKGEVYHCVRLNIDENGVMTYSAGNEDRDHAPARFIQNSEAVLISTSDYVHTLAERHYMNHDFSELMALADSRGLGGDGNTIHFADVKAQLKAELRAQTGELYDNPLARASNLRIDFFLKERGNFPDEVSGRRVVERSNEQEAQKNLPNPPTYENWVRESFGR